MPTYMRFLAVSFLTLSLTGCLASSEETGANNSSVDEDQSDAAPNTILADAQLTNDALVPPPAPTLSVQAAPSALHFIWDDQHNKSAQDITKIALYEFDSRTRVESLVTESIDTLSTRYQYKVTSHTLAWNAISYRLEICNADDCLSSRRMPIKDLLANAAIAIQSKDNEFDESFGDHVAINAEGNVAVISSPAQSSALVFFNVANKWIQANVLRSDQLNRQSDSNMRVTTSRNGDTIVLASISSQTSPMVVVFDRLGEAWIETDAFAPNATSMLAQNWNADSLHLLISDNGDRIAVAAHNKNPPPNAALDNNNRVLIFDRQAMGWANTATLSVPQLDTRIPTFTASADLSRLLILSARSESLYLHEYSDSSVGWNKAEELLLNNIMASIDNQIISNSTGDELVIASWEPDRSGNKSAVAFKLSGASGKWFRRDSVRLPPINNISAELRLASNADLSSLAIGWQASNDANVAFYAEREQFWQPLFSIPSALNLNRAMPMVQSIAISADNTTVLIGTTQTSSGGMVSVFQ